jgi:hypothetical protein
MDIVANAASFTKGWTRIALLGFGGTNGFGGFVSGTTGKLGTKAELRTSSAIDNMVQCILVGDALLPGNRRTVGCSGIEGDLGCTQFCVSRAVNAQFTAYSACGDDFTHRQSIPQNERRRPIPLSPKERQFPGHLL